MSTYYHFTILFIPLPYSTLLTPSLNLIVNNPTFLTFLPSLSSPFLITALLIFSLPLSPFIFTFLPLYSFSSVPSYLFPLLTSSSSLPLLPRPP